MKLLKNIGKVLIVYLIGFVFVFSLVIRVNHINERDSKVLQDNNYEEYYVYENE